MRNGRFDLDSDLSVAAEVGNQAFGEFKAWLYQKLIFDSQGVRQPVIPGAGAPSSGK